MAGTHQEINMDALVKKDSVFQADPDLFKEPIDENWKQFFNNLSRDPWERNFIRSGPVPEIRPFSNGTQLHRKKISETKLAFPCILGARFLDDPHFHLQDWKRSFTMVEKRDSLGSAKNTSETLLMRIGILVPSKKN